jgi:hypothetical protein
MALLVAAGTALACVALAPAPTSASSLEPQAQPEPKAAENAPVRKFVRDEFRVRLEKRLEETKEAQKKLEEAIAALDKGATREDLVAMVPNQGIFRAIYERGGGQGDGDGPRRGMRGDGPGADGPPGGPGGPDGEQRRPFNREVTDNDRVIMREILSQASPDLLAKIDELKQKDPEAAKNKLTDMFPRMRWMVDLHQRDPKIYALRLSDLALARQSLPLAKEILSLREKGTAATDPAIVKKTTDLRAIMSQQFDNREKIMRAEAESWRRRADERDKEVDKMSKVREQKIDELMELLIKHSDKPGRMDNLFGPGGPGDGPGRGERRGGGPGGPGGPGGDGPPPPEGKPGT